MDRNLGGTDYQEITWLYFRILAKAWTGGVYFEIAAHRMWVIVLVFIFVGVPTHNRYRAADREYGLFINNEQITSAA